MRCLLRSYGLDAFITQRPQVSPFEQALALPQQNRRDRDMQFINESFLKILPNHAGAAANAHIHAIRGFAGPVQRFVNATPDIMLAPCLGAIFSNFDWSENTRTGQCIC
jgi:hypothetical protein